MTKIGILVSGGGTNLQAVIDAIADGRIENARIVLVISSQAGAYALERAKKAGIRTAIVSKDDFPQIADRAAEMTALLGDAGADLILTLGYMSILDDSFIDAHRGRIINIHPSLLPRHGGKGYYGIRVHEAVIASGDTETGATVHFVTEDIDMGDIIVQRKVPVMPGDDAKTLAARVLDTEHELIVEGVNTVIRTKERKMRALLSVSDKSGLVDFARELDRLGYEIVSTGGTHKALAEAGIPVTGISDITGFPECLDGRVKTLHPAVHGGILAMRDKEEHMKQIADLGIESIDIVAINLYPFKETIRKPDVTLPVAIENIDIGGPSMLRSAAKNHKDVVVCCDPADYTKVIAELCENGEVCYDTKYKLALKVFEHTAAYDAMIAEFLRDEGGFPLPDNPTLSYEKICDLRYGENPHQSAGYYSQIRPHSGALVRAKQLHGKELSFNNINDTNGAIAVLREFDEPTVVAVKHSNPCGVASANIIHRAYIKCYEADSVSIFGGIIAANRSIDFATAEEISKIFVEIVIAPGFTDEALYVLKKKPDVRLLELPEIAHKQPAGGIDIKKVDGGILIQNTDDTLFDEENLKTVTEKEPTEKQLEDLRFAMKVVKHVKSNAIVIAYDEMTLGIGPGQTNRVGSVEIAIKGNEGDEHIRDLTGAVLASDAFFPFDDCVSTAAKAGISAIIQPGGSIRDQESIDKANELGIAMVFTGERHFKH